MPNYGYNTQHKIFQTDKYCELYKQMGDYYNLFRHTSCGISYFSKSCNKLGYQDRAGHCFPNCANYKICTAKREVSSSEVIAFMSSRLPNITNWNYVAGELNIEDEVSQEIVAFIKNALGVRVSAMNIFLSPSEHLITH